MLHCIYTNLEDVYESLTKRLSVFAFNVFSECLSHECSRYCTTSNAIVTCLFYCIMSATCIGVISLAENVQTFHCC